MTKNAARRQASLMAVLACLALLVGAEAAKPVVAQEAPACHATAPVDVSIEAQPQVSVGEPVKIRWRQRASAPGQPCPPRFLVIAVPDGVRFAGEGFVALPARAPTPHGIDLWPESTRAFVPLHLGPLTQAGTLYITPYRAGRLQVRWQVMGPAGRATAGPAARDIEFEVRTGRPQLSIEDPYFSDGRVTRSVASADGSAQIDDYGQYFRVIDRRDRELIYQAPGRNPRFSPTGRYIYYSGARSLNGGADWTRFEVFDRASGAVVLSRDRADGVGTGRDGLGHNAIVSVRWGVGDAFVSLGFGKMAGVETHQVLIDRKPYFAELGPNCCDAVQERAAVGIDLDTLLITHASKHDTIFGGRQRSLLAFSDAGLMAALDPAGAARLAVLKATEEANLKAAKDTNAEPAPFDQGAYALEEALSNRADDYIMHFVPSAPRRARAFTLAASLRWDDGGRPLDLGSGARAAAGRQLMVSRSLDQLLARPFDQIPASRQGAFHDDRLAQRLQDFGLTLLKPMASTNYVVPERGPNGRISTTWLNPMLKSVAGIQDLISDTSSCNKLEERSDGDGIDIHSAYSARAWRTSDMTLWLVTEGCSFSGSVSDFFVRFALVVQRGSGAPQLIRLNDKTDQGASVEATLKLQTASFPWPAPSAELIDGRYLLLAFADQPSIIETDLATGRVTIMKGEAGRYGAASRLYRTPDGRIVRLDRDGGLHVYAPSVRRDVLHGRYVDDELVFYDSDGFFNGTEEGSRYVYLRFPGLAEPASLRQFRATLRDPNLVTRVLNREGAPRAPQLVAPPSAMLALTDSAGSARTTITALVSATSATDLKEARLYIDGRLVETRPLSGPSASLRVDLPFRGRWLTAQVIDRLGTESPPVSAQLPQAAASPIVKPRLFVVAVGTDTYDDRRIVRLSGAVNDAKTFAALASRSAFYAQGTPPNLILDDADLRRTLPRSIKSIAERASADDTVMLQVSGHGMRTADGRLFLATRTTRVDDLEATALPWAEVVAALSQVRARVIVFLDACHSGAAGNDQANDLAASSLIDVSDSIIVLSASKGRQPSFERADAGVFTSALDRLVRQEARATDTNGNKVVELDELYRLLKAQVLRATDGKQAPWVARNGMVGPVPIF